MNLFIDFFLSEDVRKVIFLFLQQIQCKHWQSCKLEEQQQQKQKNIYGKNIISFCPLVLLQITARLQDIIETAERHFAALTSLFLLFLKKKLFLHVLFSRILLGTVVNESLLH